MRAFIAPGVQFFASTTDSTFYHIFILYIYDPGGSFTAHFVVFSISAASRAHRDENIMSFTINSVFEWCSHLSRWDHTLGGSF